MIGSLIMGALVGFSAHGMIANLLVGIVGACIFIWLGRKIFH